MHRMSLRLSLSLVLTLVLALPAWADLSKLNGRARVALAQVQSGETAQVLKERGAAVNEEGELDVFIAGSVSRAELEAAGAIVRTALPGYYTAYIPASAVEAVAALPGVVRIEGAAPVELEIDVSVPTTGANLLRSAGPGFTGFAGQNVLVGDVDTGVDYSHDDFKDAGGNTRLVTIWDQTGVGVAPLPFGYGAEWTAADINANLAAQVDVSGHGTHVLGTAGGDGSGTGGVIPAHTFVGMAPKADLCMVKTNFQTTGVFDGVAYIMNLATSLGKNAAVNLSLGSHYGPHDGSDTFEAGLSALTGPGKIICKSAGNERGVAQHAEIFAAGAGTNATMNIAGSATNRVIAIAGYYNATETIDIQITTPNGTIIGPITLGNLNAAYPGTATLNGRVYLENGIVTYPSGAREIYVEISPAAGQNMNGLWTFRAIPVALGAANGEVDFWRFFQSTGSTGNFALGNQNAEELVSEPGNSVELITVAAWTSKRVWNDCNGLNLQFNGSVNPGNLAPFSSPGPTRDGRQKPDIAAPGAAIASTTSFDIAQICAAGGSLNLADGLMHTMNQGTSMAAPHATGAAALILQKYGAVNPAFVKTFLNQRAIVDGFTGAVWNKDFGNGKLFLGDMIDPTVTVLAPNGGELFQIGQIVNLSWNASDALGGVTAVDLYLSRTGVGGPYETIALGEPNSGSYAWMSTGPPTSNAILKVVAKDAVLNEGSDTSDQDWILEAPIPTLMTLLEAEPAAEGGGIALRYEFGDPSSFTLQYVERADAASGPYTMVDVELTSSGETQIAIDRSASAGHTYWYRLVARGTSGQSLTFGPVSSRIDGGITAFALARITPNPAMRGPVRVDFTVPRDAQVGISVVDVRGRKVATLAEGRYAPGSYSVNWNTGAGDIGAGLYFIHYRTPDGIRNARVIVGN